jgi:FAD/FMN-containing dehydrogenase
VRRGDRGYEAAHELFNPRFDHIQPTAVAYCASAEDVQLGIEFARGRDLPLALRSGGHSYGGWSTGAGLVLDVSRLHAVKVTGDTATVGAGARLVDVYAGLARHDKALPAGSCPTVGITGLTLGGGLGVTNRAWGLTCDNLLGLEVVTADGAVRTADAERDPDLFWACRGGGGGNLGVVTRLTFALRPAPRMSLWSYRWDWLQAPDVLTGWQEWAAGSPRQLWSTCKLLTQPGASSPVAQVGGTWLGGPAGLGSNLRDLVDAIGHAPTESSLRRHSYLQTMLLEAGCDDVSGCTTPRTSFAGASHVLAAALPSRGVETCVDHVDRRQREGALRQAGVSFDILGGAGADLEPGATAFPHRKALAVAQYTAGWPSDGRARPGPHVAWLQRFRAAMTPFVGNTAYVNYADPEMVDWQHAYYGRNYTRLQTVKARYDPDGVFTFPQSVRPA